MLYKAELTRGHQDGRQYDIDGIWNEVKATAHCVVGYFYAHGE